MSWDELELLLLLSPGDLIEAQDKRTGRRWQGTIDIVALELRKLWMCAELGERKLIDTEAHIISKPDGLTAKPSLSAGVHPNLTSGRWPKRCQNRVDLGHSDNC
ncbi:hypothetical protein D9M72_526730 [compost metagenome]